MKKIDLVRNIRNAERRLGRLQEWFMPRNGNPFKVSPLVRGAIKTVESVDAQIKNELQLIASLKTKLNRLNKHP